MAKALEFKLDVETESTAVNKDDSSSIASGMKGVLEGLGIGSGIQIIAGIIKSFQPVLNIVSSVMKVLGVLLSPVSDLIIGLLIPIILIFKPIAIALNQIMMPFLLQAIAFFKVGAETGDATATALGFSTLLSGLNAVIIVIFAEILELVLTSGLSLIASIVGLFSSSGETFIRDELMGNISGLVETAAAAAIAGMALNIIDLNKMIGLDMTKFETGVLNSIGSIFTNVSEDYILQIGEAMKDVEENGLGTGMATLSAATLAEWANFATDGSNAITSAFETMRNAILGISSPSTSSNGSEGNGSTNSFFSRAISAAIQTVLPSEASLLWRTY